ncbi:MAG: riboflavin biosynthesis protein RibF [Magnetococcales bacterium]|nr:riboflavin biosynthesis protein RibF [Magnetococcales bacterium]
MNIIRGLRNLPSRFLGAVVAIGNFDGVHRGHCALFAHLRELAKGHPGAATMAVTFEPHPMKLLDPQRAPVRITGVRGKARWMEEQGVEALFILRFTRALAAMTPRAFVERILVEGLAAREVLVGENFRFGARGAGDYEVLIALGRELGFGVHAHPLVHVLDGQPVSSTWVRRAVEAGAFGEAEQLLNRPFEIEGRVRTGFRRGRELGFPTANISLTGILHPPSGVYVAQGWLDGEWLPAVVNVGCNPTFGDGAMGLEAHFLLPIPEELYRKVVRIRFLYHLRPEKRFPGPQALREQIARDVAEARAFFAHCLPARG